MSEKYKHVVWDWNGTLFDDAWLCIDIMNELLRSRGLPLLTSKRYEEILTFPIVDYYRRLGFDFGREPYEKLGAEFIQRYEQRRLECGLRKEALNALQRIRDSQISQSLLSAYNHQSLCEIVQYFEIEGFFAGLEGASDCYAAGKSEYALRLIERLPCEPDEVLVVGDTIHDWEVASAAGADCVLIAGGHQSRNRLSACDVPLLDSLGDVIVVATGMA